MSGGTKSEKVHTHGTDNFQAFPSSEYQFCSLCGAWRGSLGLEPTHGLYLGHLMQIMAECKRVLKPTGTIWVNIGDSYAGSGCGTNDYRTEASKSIQGIGKNIGLYKTGGIAQKIKDVPAKSLIGIPERFAIRMTDDLGMIRRNTVIWWKRNCMPSSASDRFTVDWEPVYFFVKQGDYWFKQQREAALVGFIPNSAKDLVSQSPTTTISASSKNRTDDLITERNMRCVWDIPTEPSSEPHFAMFPQKLVEPMLDAGCPPDGIVLDPFSGMATVASVAIRQGKRFIMFEASPEYAGRSRKRIDLESQQTRLEL